MNTLSAATKAILAPYRRSRTGIEARIAGIPCLIEPTHVFVQRPMGPSADSDMDCDGYAEVCFDVLDRKGYRATWLEKKMTADERVEIENLILEAA